MAKTIWLERWGPLVVSLITLNWKWPRFRHDLQADKLPEDDLQQAICTQWSLGNCIDATLGARFKMNRTFARAPRL
jgi:hypothetical protein